MSLKIPEKKLKEFAEKEHKEHKKQALIEGSVAILPLLVVFFGFYMINTTTNSQELMSPDRWGLMQLIFPLVLGGYFIFLFFVLKDIRAKVSKK